MPQLFMSLLSINMHLIWRYLGLALLGVVFCILCVLLMGGFPNGYNALVIAVAVSHAVFMIISARMIAANLLRERRPSDARSEHKSADGLPTAAIVQLPAMSASRWSISLALITWIALIAVTGGVTIVPAPYKMTAIVAGAIVFSWTPALPVLALPGLRVRFTFWSCLSFAGMAIILSLPYLLLVELLGLPLQICEIECWGVMEGGLIMIPTLGLHMFVASIMAASVSTIIYLDRFVRNCVVETNEN